MQTNPIIEIRSGYGLSDLDYCITPLTQCVGLLVIDDVETVDCHAVLDRLVVPCVGIAVVNMVKLRRHRRMAVEMALSLEYGCACRCFEFAEYGRFWLDKRVNPFESNLFG
ncbi:MAG: hypothetical protein AAFV93_13235 [Chloroflexota bacterium]